MSWLGVKQGQETDLDHLDWFLRVPIYFSKPGHMLEETSEKFPLYFTVPSMAQNCVFNQYHKQGLKEKKVGGI